MCQLCVHWRADSDGFDRTKSKMSSSSTIMLGHTPVAKPSALYSSWNLLPYHIRHTVLIWPSLTFSYFLCWRNISKEITMKDWNRCRSWGGCSLLVPIPDTSILHWRNAKTCTTLAPLYWTQWWLCWKAFVWCVTCFCSPSNKKSY